MRTGKQKPRTTRTVRAAKKSQPAQANRGQSDEAKQTRKRISDVLLEERLGLDHDWVDKWEQNGKLIEESLAPSELPRFIPARIEQNAKKGRTMRTVQDKVEVQRLVKGEMRDLNSAIDQLVAGGCRRPVLYYCLEELSPESEEYRLRGAKIGASKELLSKLPPRVEAADEELDIPAVTVRSPLATRDDLGKVARAAENARAMIFQYRRELRLLAQDAGVSSKFPVPDGITGGWKAIEVLQELLTWAARVSDQYSAPLQTNLFKSKGLLFLAAYVELVAEKYKISGRALAKMHGAVATLADIVMTKDEEGGEGEIEKHWSPSDLILKLNSFEQDSPRLHQKLLRNLRELHEFHSDH